MSRQPATSNPVETPPIQVSVALPPDLAALVTAKVATGRYASASHVVCEALRLLEVYERGPVGRVEALRRDLQAGIDQLDRGESTVYDDASLAALVDEVKAAGRRRLAQRA